MAFSSLNSFSASTGLGVSSKKTTTTYTSGLYYKGYTNNSGTYVYGVSSGNRYENALLFFTDTNTSKIFYSSGTTTNITSTELYNYVGVASTTNNVSAAATFYGYFKPNATEYWSFTLYPASGTLSNDDISTLWIGTAGQTISNLKTNASLSVYNASTNTNGYRVRNAYSDSVSTATTSILLTQDLYYPILMNWGQTTGGQVLGLAFKNLTGSYSTNGSGYYYNTGA
jgi:hypothetical protein